MGGSCDCVRRFRARFLCPFFGSIDRGEQVLEIMRIVDLSRERVVNWAELGSYSDYSLYDGWKLKGWPVRTIVRGLTVMDDGKIVGPPGHGRYLRRTIDRSPAAH